MTNDDANAAAIVGAIADGARVEWEFAEQLVADEVRPFFRALRLVAKVAEAHQTIAVDGSTKTSSMAATVDSAEDSFPRLAVASPSARGVDGEFPFQWGRLEIRGRLGAGAFGEVLLAWDPELEREVALKLLREKISESPTAASAVIREGRLLAKIRHSNVVTVYGADRHDGRVGVWMDRVRGRTLEDLLEANGPFGPHEAALIGIDLCRALAAVHGAGLVHRDVKAQNVMREAGGRIVLMDFGAGKELREEGEDQGTICGTPIYMAPEVLRGENPTPQSDLYGLGVLLYHLVTGKFPIEGPNLRALLDQHRRNEARLLRDVRPDLPQVFVRAIERALTPSSRDRYASAGAMERALVATVGEAHDAVESSSRGRQRVGRIRWLWFFAAVAVIGGCGFLIAHLGERNISLPPTPPGPSRTNSETAPASSEGSGEQGSKAADDPITTSKSAATPKQSRTSGQAQSERRKLIESLVDLALLKQAMGAYGDAQSLFERALAMQEDSFGSEHPDLARTLAGLAWVCQANGDTIRARSLYDRALKVQEAAFGPESLEVAATLTELGSILRDSGDLDAALPLLERAVRIRSKQAPAKRDLHATAKLDQLGPLADSGETYSIEAALYRSRGLEGPPERLADGDRVAPGDRLFLQVKSTEDLFVYVLSEDQQGRAYLHFPLPGFDPSNPLRAEITHRLPGRRLSDGKVISWQVDTAGGREHFLVLANRTRLQEFESELEALAIPGRAPTVLASQLSHDTADRLRGIGGIVEDSPAPPASPPIKTPQTIFDRAKRLATGSERVRGVWIRQIDLENPLQ